MKDYRIAIFFSGLEKGADESIYNIRTDELRSCAYLLKALNGDIYGKFQDTNMRDIPYEEYLKYKDQLPRTHVKRAEHWYSENDRVKKAVEAYKKGDIDSFGKLVTESGESSINNWETGSNEMIELFNIIKETKGVYGTRFSGSGFKGCCIAFIDPKEEKNILKNVEEKYCNSFPKLKNKYSAHICKTADGVKI